MKRMILHHSDKWFGIVSTDTTDPMPPHDGAPPPVPEFGTEPPINTELDQVVAFNI